MSELRFWNGTAHGIRRDWERVYIAAYSEKDAIQLYIEAGGAERGATSQIRDYFSKGWGTPMKKLVPDPKRGVYFTDDHCRSVMFVEPKARSIVDDVPAEAKAAAAEQPTPSDYGKLRVGFERGVKIDEWVYSSPFLDRAHADRMKAEVRMRRADRRGRLIDQTGIEFVATSECFGKSAEIKGPNIEKLFAEVQEAFRTFDLGQRGVVWEEWLEVSVHEEKPFGTVGGGLSIGYEIIKRGIDPRNGRVMTINDNGVVTDFPKPRAAGEKKRGDDEWRMGDDHQVSYIPATKENISALNAVIAALDGARAKLEGLLAQTKISATLASVPTIPLLVVKDTE